jgi:hypothetical protein
MLGLEESYLLEQVKAELNAISVRMHRDARRRGVLQQASLMLGTGSSTVEVTRLLLSAKQSAKSGRAAQPQKSDPR